MVQQLLFLHQLIHSCAPALGEQPIILNIPPNTYDKASTKWSQTGPFYDGNKNIAEKGGSFTHAYGKMTGKMSYPFKLPSQVEKWLAYVTVTARLSSEFPYYKAPEDGYSDVSLYLNKRWSGTRRVMPDDGKGQLYSWKFPTDLLLNGKNVIEFCVETDAEYKNGLCIYYESLVSGLDDAFITILVEPDTPQ